MSSGELSTRSWLGLAMYGLAMGLVLFPQRIQLQQRRTVLVLDHRTAPPLAALLLLASTIIPPATFWTGLVGDQQGEGVRPPDVLMLFISLAYVACALDSTGALSALALATVNTLSSHSDDRGRGRGARARGQAPAAAGERTLSGTKLYAALYVLWLLSGAIFGNVRFADALPKCRKTRADTWWRSLHTLRTQSSCLERPSSLTSQERRA